MLAWQVQVTKKTEGSGYLDNTGNPGLQHVWPCPLNWWCHPTISSSSAPFSFCLQSFTASWYISHQSALRIRWPKYWRFNFSPSNEYSGLISIRIDWFDLLAVQGTLKSLLQHHSSTRYQKTVVYCQRIRTCNSSGLSKILWFMNSFREVSLTSRFRDLWKD